MFVLLFLLSPGRVYAVDYEDHVYTLRISNNFSDVGSSYYVNSYDYINKFFSSNTGSYSFTIPSDAIDISVSGTMISTPFYDGFDIVAPVGVFTSARFRGATRCYLSINSSEYLFYENPEFSYSSPTLFRYYPLATTEFDDFVLSHSFNAGDTISLSNSTYYLQAACYNNLSPTPYTFVNNTSSISYVLTIRYKTPVKIEPGAFTNYGSSIISSPFSSEFGLEISENLSPGSYFINLYIYNFSNFSSSSHINCIVSSSSSSYNLRDCSLVISNDTRGSYMYLSGFIDVFSSFDELRFVASSFDSGTLDIVSSSQSCDYMFFYQISSDQSIDDALHSAGGANNSTNDAIDNMGSQFGEYQQSTDTSSQYDNITDDLFEFDTSVWSQMASTITLFSSCVTLNWTALGDFSTALTVFLIVVLVISILGLARYMSTSGTTDRVSDSVTETHVTRLGPGHTRTTTHTESRTTRSK